MKLLFKADLPGGEPYRVYLSTSAETESLEGNYGVTDVEHRTIHIEASLHPATYRDTLLHETLHAVIAGSSLGHFLKDAVKRVGKLEQWLKWEELFVRTLTPILYQGLVATGWTPPRIPPSIRKNGVGK